jgi:outer membrane lipoprotein carrier protein
MDSVKFSHRLRRPITDLVVSLCLLATGPAWSQAGLANTGAEAGAAALLDDFVAEVQDLSAGFVQQRFDENGEVVEEPSTGSFRLLRPGLFRWHYDPPDEQIIVADGEWLWFYDVLIEQVEKRPASDLATSPAMILSDAALLRDRYAVTELPPADGKRWLELTPLDSDASEFVTARLGFVEGLPVVLEIVDGLNELTRVDFDGIEVNTGLTRDEFVFEPPPGVTVISADD